MCKSLHHCRRCQKPHHTLLHIENRENQNRPASTDPVTTTSHHVLAGIESNMLLMTCQVLVETHQGTVKARALLDSASSASFVSEKLAQTLRFRRLPQSAKICGVAPESTLHIVLQLIMYLCSLEMTSCAGCGK